MNTENSALLASNPQEVTSLLVPFGGSTLLFPTVSVAEMVPFRSPESVADSPDWLLGTIQWRNQSIPVMSYEVLNGQEAPGIAEKSRLAVINATGLSDDLGFFALLTQGIPRLARVTQDEMGVDSERTQLPYDTLSVFISGESAVIPNVSAIEKHYLDWRERE